MATEPTDIKPDDDNEREYEVAIPPGDDETVDWPLVDDADEADIAPVDEDYDDDYYDDTASPLGDEADIVLIGGWYRTVEASTHKPTNEPDEREKRIRAWLRRRIDGNNYDGTQ